MAGSIAGVQSSSSVTAPTSTAGLVSGADQLGKQDFLQLLIAQLRNQDPLKPMEDRDFMAQLAQFSSLEALQSLDKKIEAMAKSSALEQASGLVGKTIRATQADGSSVEGKVTEMRMVNDQPKLVVADKLVDLDSVTAVLS
jgi:flagellar basal-body rod modification protein FlgD